MFLKVLLALAMACWTASSKFFSEIALISVTVATLKVMAHPFRILAHYSSRIGYHRGSETKPSEKFTIDAPGGPREHHTSSKQLDTYSKREQEEGPARVDMHDEPNDVTETLRPRAARHCAAWVSLTHPLTLSLPPAMVRKMHRIS
jgi:hypothetical protein